MLVAPTVNLWASPAGHLSVYDRDLAGRPINDAAPWLPGH